MDDIIKLIDLSMEDGMLDKTDYEIIRKKAEQAGISEEELNLIISKRAKAPDKPLLEFNPSQKRTSVLPYILASLAIGFSFMNWFKAYSNTSVMGAKSDWEMYFSGWWGGYGATIILLYAIGCFLYFRSFRFYWIFGILAILDALYIYSALVNTDVSISYNYGGYGGSSKTGYDFAWGFWAYIVATGLFTFNGIVSEHILKGKKNVSLFGHFKENLKNGWKPMVLSSLISSIVILSDFLIDFDGDLIESLVIGLMLFVAISLYMVLVYVISPNARAAGYIVGAIHLALFIIDIFLLPDGANKPQLLLVLMVFPLSYILVERILNSKKNTSAIKGGVSCAGSIDSPSRS